MQLRARPVGVSATAVSLIAAATVGYWHYDGLSNAAPEVPVASATVAPAVEVRIPEALPIASGDTLSNLLLRAGVDQPVVGQIADAVQPTFDVRQFRAGSELLLTRTPDGAIEQIEYVIDADRKLTVSHTGETFASAVSEIPGTVRVTPVCGSLHGSLFESMQRMGERPELAVRMAEIFRWDLDFYKDPQPGDDFCLVLEKKEYLNGQAPSYGRLLGARYNNKGTVHEAWLFPDEHGKAAWFSRDGRSLQSAFLRSPIKFEARVSSRFSPRRLHPVLGQYRPHWGTDYAVPTGTPVMAVADGTVVFSGRSGGAGNLVRIKHVQGYETAYLHLSRRLVRQGQRVQQGQRIGLVGATGLATGPHLDLRISRNGKYLDFEKLKPPKRSKITGDRLAQFNAVRERYAALMESPSPVVVAGVGPAGSDVAVD